MHLFGGQRSKRDTAETKTKKKKKKKKKAAGVAYRERGDKKGPKRRWLDGCWTDRERAKLEKQRRSQESVNCAAGLSSQIAVRKERQRAVKEESSCQEGRRPPGATAELGGGQQRAREHGSREARDLPVTA
ncbi:uncharacterized protein ARB_05857 [Trichophyton benhamiae CBS 112371]|uniref:Uncharacterized protein n=1 Tax=Arthroderma benhamiae (strain ATCC MYA-4681 / CBS 112371) TaxID=663331 RepID=D4ANP0_ARTBC|nr:uncharacterized protein ARB_05857 [Trichophyton benhamiae CBS 112371]EFE34901.1 hypothetical protein ARB_05857 [Trichophyton benhamiae CBS 112371]